jgi:hypothetical protein
MDEECSSATHGAQPNKRPIAVIVTPPGFFVAAPVNKKGKNQENNWAAPPQQIIQSQSRETVSYSQKYCLNLSNEVIYCHRPIKIKNIGFLNHLTIS